MRRESQGSLRSQHGWLVKFVADFASGFGIALEGTGYLSELTDKRSVMKKIFSRLSIHNRL